MNTGMISVFLPISGGLNIRSGNKYASWMPDDCAGSEIILRSIFWAESASSGTT
jgi:hypothetical protein